MKFREELAALHDYIARFDPEQFSTTGTIEIPTDPSPERLAEIQRLRQRLARKRQLAESIHHLCDIKGMVRADEIILTQAEVDALLDGWIPAG